MVCDTLTLHPSEGREGWGWGGFGGMWRFGGSEGREGIVCLEVVIGHIVLAGCGDLGGRKGEREFYALRWGFSTLCWRDGATWVVGREIRNFMP